MKKLEFIYNGSPDQRSNKLRHDVMSLSSVSRTQCSMYDREVAWDLNGEEISFEEIRAMRYHGLVNPLLVLPQELTGIFKNYLNCNILLST